MRISRQTADTSVLRVKLHPRATGVRFQFHSPKHPAMTGELAVDLSVYCNFLRKSEIDLISSAALLIVAGFFVPYSIIVEWDSSAVVQDEFRELLRILYDIRAYCSKTDFHHGNISIQPSNQLIEPCDMASTRMIAGSISDGYSHMLLFSGGIDSTYSMIKLVEEGRSPLALFLNANTDTIDFEWEASCRIASKLEFNILRCNYISDGLPQRGANRYLWPQFGQFPYYNSIPHGRDILSAAVASVIASRLKINSIAFGQEKESREKVLNYKGRRILRHDVESSDGAAILNRWLCNCLNPELKIVSPIASLTIEQIRLTMIDRYPDILSMTQSCFWERCCCQCVKCVSSFILQRITGKNIFEFPENPLSNPHNRDLADIINSDVPDNEIGYGAQIRDGIRTIIKTGSYSEEDYWVIRALKNPTFLS